MTMRGALEFGFYAEETDGVLLDKTKFYWNADYGHLSFTTDHHLLQNCDGFGSGDAAMYPGAAPETGAQATSFYKDAPRANTVVTKCDLRGSQLGYSGSMGNGVRITDNHIYGNTTGIASDTLSSAGHPGFPADSSEIDHNYIYSNNFNIYRKNSPVKPLVAVPLGTGIIYAGMNDAKVHDNWIFDNWRDGAMLIAVPDALVSGGGAEGDIFPGISCAGRAAERALDVLQQPLLQQQDGPGAARASSSPRRSTSSAPPTARRASARMPNGNDFWWDGFTSNRWNCWYGNTGPDGKAGSVTGPGRRRTRAGHASRTGCPTARTARTATRAWALGDPAKTEYLVDCSNGPDTDTSPLACDWWVPPAKPGSAAAQRAGGRVLGRGAQVQRLTAGRAPGTQDGRPVGRVVLGRRLAPLLAGAILLAGCGGEDEEPAQPVPAKAQSVGKRTAGSVVQFADCSDWNRGTRAEREATVRELRDQLTAAGRALERVSAQRRARLQGDPEGLHRHRLRGQPAALQALRPRAGLRAARGVTSLRRADRRAGGGVAVAARRALLPG